MTRLIEVAAIAGLLAARIETLCIELLPNGRREGREWRVGSIAGEPGRSMAVHLAGERAGAWCDFGAADKRGDALDLVAQVLFGGDKKRAILWSRAWLGLDHAGPPSCELRSRRDAGSSQATRTENATRGAAMRLFLGARLSLAGTPAEAYLAARGIMLAKVGRQPRSLRYEPRCWNTEIQSHCPALIAAISDRNGTVVAVHRTWLQTHSDGRVTKAPLRDPKKTLGSYRGGAVRLWRGATRVPLSDAAPGEWVMVAEGIEDALSAAMGRADLRALAAVSLANMASLWLPDTIEGVIILAQNDPPGSPAAAALDRAVRHFQDMGKRVKIARPPPGLKDVNDVLRGEGAA